ncbi:MAG: hypothetical protein AAFQ43_09355 [Bacteroidota bacterium]
MVSGVSDFLNPPEARAVRPPFGVHRLWRELTPEACRSLNYRTMLRRAVSVASGV